MTPLIGVTCVVCGDEESNVIYSCSTRDCEYRLCGECIAFAFEGTEENSARCPTCKKEGIAVRMVEAVVGSIGVNAVKDELRSVLEFDVKTRLEVQKVKAVDLSTISCEARRIFNEITEDLILKCPRCKAAFLDYDGCNALYCSCGCKFCAICLEDCGADAHPHVRSMHGNLFDKGMFEESKIQREKSVVEKRLESIATESPDLRQMVRNHLERAGISAQKFDATRAQGRIFEFLSIAKNSLRDALRRERLALLQDPSSPLRRIDTDAISPRFIVPDNYRLCLEHAGDSTFKIVVTMKNDRDKWILVPLETLDEKGDDKGPVPDILMNLKYAMHCATIAIEGERHLYQTLRVNLSKRANHDDSGNDLVDISFRRVDINGDIGNTDEFTHFHGDLNILGLASNLRINLLVEHVNRTDEILLVPEPIKHLIGAGKSLPLLTDLSASAPDTVDELNDEQRRVAHPLCIKSAMEVSGPPGTGKTKTITELTRSLLGCTEYGIIVLSERNGAIDAIAEKFASNCMFLNGNKVIGIKDIHLWLNVITFGASSIGKYTEMFTLEEKLQHHPELVAMRKKEKEYAEALDTLAKNQRRHLASVMYFFADQFGDESGEMQGRVIERNNDLRKPGDVIAFVKNAITYIPVLRSTLRETEDVFEKYVGDHLSDMLGLIFRSPGNSMKDKPLEWKERRRIIDKKLTYLLTQLNDASEHKLFDESHAEKLLHEWREAGTKLKAHDTKLREELVTQARLKMSTIGSSHKLPSIRNKKFDDEDDDLVDRLDGLELNGGLLETVVIIDEAGCIPTHELLGLSRLKGTVKSIVLVGDEHQLPPYNPSDGCINNKNGRQDRYEEKKVQSLLSVSKLTFDDAKVQLNKQYRVPRDIADLLDTRIYNRQYNTAASANVPLKGFNFIHVPFMVNKRRKYVNDNEVEKVISLTHKSIQDGCNSIMILTPYKNQQREIQFQLKREFKDGLIPVLTIDQCQGQEADIVILSMVQKPTRFLNKNRLNVALSRVRIKLYFLVDKALFREASRNSFWECNLIAKDLLYLSDDF